MIFVIIHSVDSIGLYIHETLFINPIGLEPKNTSPTQVDLKKVMKYELRKKFL